MTKTVLPDLDPVAVEFAGMLAEFLAKRVDSALLGRLDSNHGAFPADLWQDIAGLGCLEISTEPNAVSLSVAALSEFGYAGLCSPLLNSLAGALTVRQLDRGGNPAPAGASPMATVLSAAMDSGPPRISAGPDGRCSMSGGPFLVEWLDDARQILVLCRSAGGGFAVAPVAPRQRGVNVTPTQVIDHEHSYLVEFDNVVTEPGSTVDVSDDEAALSVATSQLLRAAVLTGLARRAVDMTATHTTQRIQFGRPLSKLPTVRQNVADMVTKVTAMASLVAEAATNVDESTRDAEYYCRIAAIFAAQAAEQVVICASQLHGGIGFIVEHPLHFIYRHTKGLQLRMGGTQRLIDIAAERLLQSLMAQPRDWLTTTNPHEEG